MKGACCCCLYILFLAIDQHVQVHHHWCIIALHMVVLLGWFVFLEWLTQGSYLPLQHFDLSFHCTFLLDLLFNGSIILSFNFLNNLLGHRLIEFLQFLACHSCFRMYLSKKAWVDGKRRIWMVFGLKIVRFLKE